MKSLLVEEFLKQLRAAVSKRVTIGEPMPLEPPGTRPEQSYSIALRSDDGTIEATVTVLDVPARQDGIVHYLDRQGPGNIGNTAPMPLHDVVTFVARVFRRLDEVSAPTAPKQPSRGALELADQLIREIQERAKGLAPCLRDDLEDHRAWVRLHIADALDRAADGRPLCTDENGPY